MSVVQPLPDHPNLTSLRKQAKSLLHPWSKSTAPVKYRAGSVFSQLMRDAAGCLHPS